MAARPLFPEAWLRRVWERPQLLRNPLRTVDGRRLRVLATGAPNPGDGPDFLGATLLFDETPLRGDVEFHFDSADWFAHSHDRDDRYRNVVLHVVLDHTTPGFGIRRADRTWIPTVELRRALRSSLGAFLRTLAANPPDDACPLPTNPAAADERWQSLDDLSEARFLRKSQRFAERTRVVGEDAAFYEALADALGYAANRAPFAKLVERAPLPACLSGLADFGEAYLLGVAGLLPSMRGVVEPSPYVAALELRWREACGAPPPMSRAEWRSSPTRSANRPARRVVALARLTAAFDGRFLDGLEPLARSDAPDRGWRERWNALEAADDGYWATHSDFGEPSSRRTPALVGESRSRDVWVNVVLPAFLARADARRDKPLRERIVALYRAHPALASNAKTEWVERRSLAPNPVRNARRQQGALELYDAYCEPRRCRDCPLAAIPRP